ncbi:hypothetical protein SAMN04488044_0557 [Cognatishimia maritima]|uniref:Uncharacterized protein n=1 Tax=Cognatishimia maritima TaxID=870908 RepID=A0A1M5J5Y3_9RHOB|nr:hypothetical protein SAMN04488044_0557 [Cognatishimia maritima]
MTPFAKQDSPRPRAGVKPPPWGAVGGCPAAPDNNSGVGK